MPPIKLEINIFKEFQVVFTVSSFVTNPDEIVRGLMGDIQEDWGEGIFGRVQGKGMVSGEGEEGQGSRGRMQWI